MILKEQLAKSRRNWLLGWVVWPIIAYWGSCTTGFAMIVFFPVMLTVAQWYVLKSRAGNRHSAYWFVLLAIYGVIYYSTPRLTIGIDESIGYTGAVFEFYACQCAAELLLFSMFSSWRVGWYSLSNILAYAIWYIAFKLSVSLVYRESSDVWMTLIIPAIALLTNTMTGYGLLKATEITRE